MTYIGDSDSYTTEDTGKPAGDITYVLGLSFAILVLLISLSYASYLCSRHRRARSPPPDDGRQLMAISRGVDDAVLMTFPAFVYSEVMTPQKVDGNIAGGDANGSGCSICLGDYKPADVIRLLPECGHLFHRKCIDTWLKVHPTCPVCRNSPLLSRLAAGMVPLPIQRS
ncbi:hypothetical protein L6452_11587 [Arctium lappa]|uniref:Uncharacterized protein n=1 Tax=Arctium lappa TaxID=4217 RepID=A0ACB9DPA8_ARCLA|nr:hypothetical protein L6452_11587 [Arctium lappa]